MADEIHVNREQEEGAKGGSAAAAYAPAGVYAQPVEQGLLLKDRVRWASVCAGLVVAFAVQVWLTVIGLAIYARQLSAAPANTGGALGIWAGVAALIALFIGGLLASRLAGVAGTANGLWNGIVLWGLSFTVLVILGSLGAGGILNAAYGNVLGGGFAGATPHETNMALNVVRAGAWTFVVFQFLGLCAAAIGGAVGARPEVETEDVSH